MKSENAKLAAQVVIAVCEEKERQSRHKAKELAEQHIAEMLVAWGLSRRFVSLMKKYGYLDQITYLDCENEHLDAEARGIIFRFDGWDDRHYVCLDPKAYYIKPSRCSIRVFLNGSRRQMKRLEHAFERINEDGAYRRRWMREAPFCWYGEWNI